MSRSHPKHWTPPRNQNQKTWHTFWAVLVGKWRKCYQTETLFRSLSFCLYRSQDRHLEIRKILVGFIRAHSDRYKPLLLGRTLSEHLESMKKLFVWGTQVELQAAADYYDMCIYLLTKREQQERYHWHRYTPRRSSVATDKLPHIELAHPGSVHFDVILDAATLRTPKSLPELDGATEYFEVIL